MTEIADFEKFKPYNESVIWQISDKYYRTKGVMAWSNKAPKIIPHKIGTNYQSAMALAKLLQANLEQHPARERVKVLECGAGSGRFSRNFLLAVRELGIADKVTLLITDYSKNNLEEIQSRGILEGFREGIEYELLVFNIIDDSKASDLQGIIYVLDNIRIIFLHYVLDALPMTILKHSELGGLEELYLSTTKRSDQSEDVLENDFLQARLEHEEQWLSYDWMQQSAMEKEFQGYLLSYYAEFNKEIFYSYAALKACDNLMHLLDKDGFLLSVDIVPNRDRSFRFAVVGNSIAHEVDNDFLLHYLKARGFHGFMQNDTKNISRLIVAKNPELLSGLKSVYDDVFVLNNVILRYIELEKQADEFTGDQLAELKLILDELLELSPFNALTYELWSRYYKAIGDEDACNEALKKATGIDFWGDL